jgi:hypothetical protein
VRAQRPDVLGVQGFQSAQARQFNRSLGDVYGRFGHQDNVDPHGDTPTTITLPGAGGTAIGIDAWTDTDEYGNPTTGTTDTVTQGAGYGWLGAHKRATTDTGLMLMGARLYNRTAGQFTSTDPVYGGNSTPTATPRTP